jgi:hypothetical protein
MSSLLQLKRPPLAYTAPDGRSGGSSGRGHRRVVVAGNLLRDQRMRRRTHWLPDAVRIALMNGR